MSSTGYTELKPTNNLEFHQVTRSTIDALIKKEILSAICALRNSGGGRLKIGLSGFTSNPEVETRADIIKDAVEKAMAGTSKNDLLAWSDLNRIIFLVKGSNEIVTMEYNMYIIEDGKAKRVPSTKSAAEVRSLLPGQKLKLPSAKQLDKNVSVVQPFNSCERATPDINEMNRKRKSRNDANKRITKRYVSTRAGFYGGPSPMISTPSVMSSSEILINRNITHDCTIPYLIKGRRLETTVPGKNVKILEDVAPRLGVRVSSRITHEKNKLLEYVAAFAICGGGDLYYGVSPDGLIRGEKMSESEKETVCKEVRIKIESCIVSPKHVDKSKLFEIASLAVHNEDEMREYRGYDELTDPYAGSISKCYVIKITVHPSSDELFLRYPVSYHVVKNKVERISFPKWLSCLKDSTTITPDATCFIDFGDDDSAFERIFFPPDYGTFLKTLNWVEKFQIVDANEECDQRNLEIVWKLGQNPRIADIMEYFWQDSLPFITYRECSKREWFESNMFDENSDLCDKYENELLSLPWVKDYYIGVANEPEKSWQIYITCAKNKLPSMEDLKKLFGLNIASFVDFRYDDVDEESKRDKPQYLRGPISGDEIFVQEDNHGGYGSIGVLLAADGKHYATTCYHVCFKNELPREVKETHRILKEDFANGSNGCHGATCLYKIEEERKDLGKFSRGLYDDEHDIALIELNQSLNCSNMVESLQNIQISPDLATKKDVRDMFFDKRDLPVEKVSLNPTKGKLVGLRAVRRCPRNKRCYRIEKIGNNQFASEGDSGSLVYLIYNKEKIPFAYLCMVYPESGKNVYYCRNLKESTEKLTGQNNVKACITRHNNSGH